MSEEPPGGSMLGRKAAQVILLAAFIWFGLYFNLAQFEITDWVTSITGG